MSKKKKSDNQKSEQKQGPAPLLQEKKSLLKHATETLNGAVKTVDLRSITKPIENGLKGFGKIALFAVPGIFVASATLTATDMLLHGRVMPGTKIGSQNIGLLYADEAGKMLEDSAVKYTQTPMPITVEGVVAQVTPQELGMQYASARTLRSMPVYDIRKNSVMDLAFAAVFPKELTPAIDVDVETAQGVIEQKLDLKKYRAQDASITLDDKKNPTILGESAGKTMSKKELMAALKQSIKTLGPISVNLELIDEQPSITAQALEPKKKTIADALKKNITLSYGGRQWKFDPSKHSEAVTFEKAPEVTIKSLNITLPVVLDDGMKMENGNISLNASPAIVLDEERVKGFLQDEIIAKIDHPTSDVKIYTDANKKIIIEGKGQNGVKVSPRGLIESINLAMNHNIAKLQVPAAEEKANVAVSEDLQSLGIKNLIATGHSAFAGSHAGRIKNINVGISKYNGLLVQPGEVFSFNEHLGEVDAANGFVPELVIKAEGTVPEYGGGLCQVSSTMYRAALYAGFPIVERAPHSYAVSYYAQVMGYGMDGTIYPGVRDVKFKNDSPGAVVMQAYTEGDQAYFKFYGSDDGRKVRMEGPYVSNYRSPGPTQVIQSDKLPPGARKQVEVNHTGFDVTWYRYIVKDSQEIKETIFSRYQATPAKVMVGRGGTSEQASVPST